MKSCILWVLIFFFNLVSLFCKAQSDYEISSYDSLQYRFDDYSVNVYSHTKDSEGLSLFVKIKNSKMDLNDTIYFNKFYVPFSHFVYAEKDSNYKRTIAMADYNLDGYKDIKIVGESYGNYILFIYEPLTKQFACKIELGYNYLFSLNKEDSILLTVNGPPCATGGSFRDSTYYNI